MAGKNKKTSASPVPSDPLASWPPLPVSSSPPPLPVSSSPPPLPVSSSPVLTLPVSSSPVLTVPVSSTPVTLTSVATTLHPQAPVFVPVSMPPTALVSSTPAFTASVSGTVVPTSPPPLSPLSSPSPTVVPSSVPHLPLSMPPPTDTSLLYSPTAGISPSSLQKLTQSDADSLLHELRSSMAYCMDRFRSQETQILSLSSVVAQQHAELQTLRADFHRIAGWTQEMGRSIDSRFQGTREEISRLRTQVEEQEEEFSHLSTWAEEYSHSLVAGPREVSVPVPVAEIQEKIATIQSEVQRHSEWVEVARRKPPPGRSATVSETLAESGRRAQRSLNLRIRGIEKSDTVSSLQQAQDFVVQTMGITDHGIVSAYRAGTDTSRDQPLIVRFRDAETRLAVLRRRRRLRDSPQIHLDEDLTPLQWQDYRALLPQRHAARQEGLWAVIRDGRLITRPLRTAQPAPAPTG